MDIATSLHIQTTQPLEFLDAVVGHLGSNHRFQEIRVKGVLSSFLLLVFCRFNRYCDIFHLIAERQRARFIYQRSLLARFAINSRSILDEEASLLRRPLLDISVTHGGNTRVLWGCRLPEGEEAKVGRRACTRTRFPTASKKCVMQLSVTTRLDELTLVAQSNATAVHQIPLSCRSK